MSAADDLKLSLEKAIEGGIEPWLPGFGPSLARKKWEFLEASVGIVPATYGTARIRARDAGVERDVASSVALPAAFAGSRDLLVETLRPVPAARYADLGLDFAASELAGSPGVVARVKAGLQVIAMFPSIAASVGSVLQVLHVAVPEGPDYDVSYSDPEVPFSIFVGISSDGPGDSVADLRLAESVIHEAMHLQLTLVEDVLPLIADDRVQYYSPWQERMRPARGIFHGTYVFVVIRAFMTAVTRQERCPPAARLHAKERDAATAREIELAARQLMNGSALTESGRNLLRLMMSDRGAAS